MEVRTYLPIVAVLLALTGCGGQAESQPVRIDVAATEVGAAGHDPVLQTDPEVKDSNVDWREQAVSGNELLSTAELNEARARWGSRVGLAVVGLHDSDPAGFEARGSAYAWSTTKILVVAQLLADLGGPDKLSEQQRRDIEYAITESDNEAATSLNEALKDRHAGPVGTAAILTELVRQAGDTRTDIRAGKEPTSTYGLSQWRVQDQVVFFSKLFRGCVIDAASTDYLVSVMGRVIAEQSWGLGTVGSTAFKGGWGAKTGEDAFEVRQVGLMHAPDGDPYVVAIATWPAEESLEAGQLLATEVAKWVDSKIVSAPQPTYCSQ